MFLLARCCIKRERFEQSLSLNFLRKSIEDGRARYGVVTKLIISLSRAILFDFIDKIQYLPRSNRRSEAARRGFQLPPPTFNLEKVTGKPLNEQLTPQPRINQFRRGHGKLRTENGRKNSSYGGSMIEKLRNLVGKSYKVE